MCGDGFEADGDWGCAAIEPAEPCIDGQLAYLGETSCHQIAPCGAGTWGDIPVEADTVYVDVSYQVGDGDGTASKPFPTIQQGLDAAAVGAIVAVAAGTYPELVNVIRPVTLWGRCPSMVEMTHAFFTLVIGSTDPNVDASGSVVRGLSITSGDIGVAASDARDVTLAELWVHDTGGGGILVGDSWGPASVTVERTLIERAHGIGLAFSNADADVTDVVVRGTRDGALARGRGVSAEMLDASAVSLGMRRTSIVDNLEAGLEVAGVALDLDSSLIRGTAPTSAGLFGRGVSVRPGLDSAALTPIVMRRSVVEDNHDVGVALAGADGLVEHVVVQGTQPRGDGEYGRGISVQHEPSSGVRSSVRVRESRFAANHEAGVGVVSADAELESLLVVDTLPRPDGLQGIDVVVSYDAADPMSVAPASAATLSWSRMERGHVAGIAVIGSSLTLVDSWVGATLTMADGRFGDGVAVLAGAAPALLDMDGCLVADNPRAGVVSFGAQVNLENVALQCNRIHLDGEPFLTDYAFVDGGGNRCGCGDEVQDCQVMSSSLEQPLPP